MSEAQDWIPICPLSDILPWTGVAARIEGVQVAIFRISDDRVLAIGNHDPFSGANVLSRGIVGDLGGKLVVASPIYKQHFLLETGVCLEDDTVSVGSWPVRVFDGQVMISRKQSIAAA